jgi:hypothetical protein
VDVIYAPEAEINVMKTLRDNGKLSSTGMGDKQDDRFSLDDLSFS